MDPKISFRYLMAAGVMLVNPYKSLCPSMDMLLQATINAVILNNVTSSVMFSRASPDPFRSVTCAQGEPNLIWEKEMVPVVYLPVLVFNGKFQSHSTAVSTCKTCFGDCLIVAPVVNLLVISAETD